jgi:hypothetical protein
MNSEFYPNAEEMGVEYLTSGWWFDSYQHPD